MPLPEIADFLQNRDIDRIEEKLQQQSRRSFKSSRRSNAWSRRSTTACAGFGTRRARRLTRFASVQLPACRIVWVSDCLRIGASADMEAPIRKLDRSGRRSRRLSRKGRAGYFGGASAKAQTAQYDGIFLILDRKIFIPAKRWSCRKHFCVRLRFRGSHADAPAQYRKLLRYMDEHRMQISGFSREVTLIDYGVTNDTEKFVTEICIPVQGS